MFAGAVRKQFKSEDGKFHSTVSTASGPVGDLFPQLSLVLRVDHSSRQFDQILGFLLGQVPRYRRLTRLLLGLFDASVREEFFKKPIVDQIFAVDPITGKRQYLETNTPVWPIGPVAVLETLRDATLLAEIERNYLLRVCQVNENDERERRLSIALSLLTRAEQSLQDVTAQFLYLFTAVETLCGNEKAPESTKKKNSELYSRLKDLVDGDLELLPLVRSIKDKLDLVPLSERFKFYQQRWGTEELPQARREGDVNTMSCANLKRNALVHRGDDTILFEDVMNLQSLVSRYVRMELARSKKSPDWIVQTNEISLKTLFDPRAAVDKWIGLFLEGRRKGQTRLISCLLELVQTLRAYST